MESLFSNVETISSVLKNRTANFPSYQPRLSHVHKRAEKQMAKCLEWEFHSNKKFLSFQIRSGTTATAKCGAPSSTPT